MDGFRFCLSNRYDRDKYFTVGVLITSPNTIQFTEWIECESGYEPLTEFTVNIHQFLILHQNAASIQRKFDKQRSKVLRYAYELHCGANVCVTVEPDIPCVNLRHWSYSNGSYQVCNKFVKNVYILLHKKILSVFIFSVFI